MTERLTVVFEDPELYRNLKVHAAEEGVAMKRVIEEAVREFLGRKQARDESLSRATSVQKLVDWDLWETNQRLLDALPAPDDLPDDLSNIKRHLYRYPRRELTHRGLMQVAEDTTPYDAG